MYAEPAKQTNKVLLFRPMDSIDNTIMNYTKPSFIQADFQQSDIYDKLKSLL